MLRFHLSQHERPAPHRRNPVAQGARLRSVAVCGAPRGAAHTLVRRMSALPHIRPEPDGDAPPIRAARTIETRFVEAAYGKPGSTNVEDLKGTPGFLDFLDSLSEGNPVREGHQFELYRRKPGGQRAFVAYTFDGQIPTRRFLCQMVEKAMIPPGEYGVLPRYRGKETSHVVMHIDAAPVLNPQETASAQGSELALMQRILDRFLPQRDSVGLLPERDSGAEADRDEAIAKIGDALEDMLDRMDTLEREAKLPLTPAVVKEESLADKVVGRVVEQGMKRVFAGQAGAAQAATEE